LLNKLKGSPPSVHCPPWGSDHGRFERTYLSYVVRDSTPAAFDARSYQAPRFSRRLDHRHAFNGADMQLGDIAAAVALAYLDLRFPDIDWRARHPGLLPFAERMFARESFKRTQPPAG